MSDCEEEENGAIVIDNGTGYMKSGFAGDDAPLSIIPSVVRKNEIGNGKYLCGNEALTLNGCLTLRYPIEHGMVTNWTGLEQLWQYIFYNELHIAPEEHPLCVAHCIGSGTKSPREKMIQIAFETFNVPAYYTVYPQILACYASGRTTGLVLDSGHGITYSMPIYEGYGLPHATQRFYLAGHNVTQYLGKLLSHKLNKNVIKDNLIMQNMKEELLYVARDVEHELTKLSCTNVDYILPGYLRVIENDLGTKCRQITQICNYKPVQQLLSDYLAACDNWRSLKQYTLPDGSIIELDEEQFKCTEMLFNPQLIGLEQEGMHKIMYQSIMSCDCDIRRDLYGNIILSGGNTMFSGIVARVTNEMKTLAPQSIKVKIIAPPERQFSVWIGGSILASLSTFQEMWIHKIDYDESGPGVVHRKCI
eukprot:349145_1